METADQRLLFRELVVPFGAHLRYLVFASRPQPAVVGRIPFPSPAWRMAARDAWVGWEDGTREGNLRRVVNNSRFLILPRVRVTNLASKVLSVPVRQAERDWPRRYKDAAQQLRQA